MELPARRPDGSAQRVRSGGFARCLGLARVIGHAWCGFSGRLGLPGRERGTRRVARWIGRRERLTGRIGIARCERLTGRERVAGRERLPGRQRLTRRQPEPCAVR